MKNVQKNTMRNMIIITQMGKLGNDFMIDREKVIIIMKGSRADIKMLEVIRRYAQKVTIIIITMADTLKDLEKVIIYMTTDTK